MFNEKIWNSNFQNPAFLRRGVCRCLRSMHPNLRACFLKFLWRFSDANFAQIVWNFVKISWKIRIFTRKNREKYGLSMVCSIRWDNEWGQVERLVVSEKRVKGTPEMRKMTILTKNLTFPPEILQKWNETSSKPTVTVVNSIMHRNIVSFHPKNLKKNREKPPKKVPDLRENRPPLDHPDVRKIVSFCTKTRRRHASWKVFSAKTRPWRPRNSFSNFRGKKRVSGAPASFLDIISSEHAKTRPRHPSFMVCEKKRAGDTPADKFSSKTAPTAPQYVLCERKRADYTPDTIILVRKKNASQARQTTLIPSKNAPTAPQTLNFPNFYIKIYGNTSKIHDFC